MDWNVDTLTRLFIATILGGMIGWERERMNRAAGLRTHVLVSIGSALFTILSLTAFREIGKVNDPARIAAQVVSGIGFLGAGTIMKHGATVKGLTTAATLWVVAAIGMACGAGCFLGAITTCIVALLALISLRFVEQSISDRRLFSIDITTEMEPGKLAKIHGVFELLDIKLQRFELGEEDNNLVIHAQLLTPSNLASSVIIESLHDIGVSHVDLQS